MSGKCPISKQLFKTLDKLKEIGEVERHSNRYKLKDQVCRDYSGEKITLNQSLLLFKILLVGFLASLFWLILEKNLSREMMNSLFAFGNINIERMFIKDKNWSHVVSDNDTRNVVFINGVKYVEERWARSEFVQHQEQTLERKGGFGH